MDADMRIIITRPVLGGSYDDGIMSKLMSLASMQVCVTGDATDEEILEHVNRENPSGTSCGWTRVVRKDDDRYQGAVACADKPGRLHLLVLC